MVGAYGHGFSLGLRQQAGGAPAPTPTPTPAPTFTTQPSITSDGTPQVGETLTGNDGTIANGSVSTRQWLLNGTAISGATGPTYVPTQTGDHAYRVTATGAGGSATATSAAVTVAAAGTPTPTPVPGYTLDPTAQTSGALLTSQPGWATGTGSGATTGFTFTGTPRRLVTPNLSRTRFVVRDAGSTSYLMRAMVGDATQRLLVRYTDPNNYCFLDVSSTTIAIRKCVGGTTILSASPTMTKPTTVIDRDQITIEVNGNTVSAYFGNDPMRPLTQVGTFDISDLPASTLVGYFDYGAFKYGSLEIAPLTAPGRSIRLAAGSRIYQRERSGANAGKAPVAITGTFTGLPPNRFRIFNETTGVDVAGLGAQAATPTINGAAWSFPSAYVPASTDLYRIEVWRDDQPLAVARSSSFGIGEMIYGYGQSGAAGYAGVIAPAYTHHPAAWYYRGQTNFLDWSLARATGGAQYEVGRLISGLVTALGCAVGIAITGGGGQTIAYISKGNTEGTRRYDAPGEAQSSGMSAVEVSARIPTRFGSILFIHHGPSDASDQRTYAYYKATMAQLFADMRADFGLPGSDTKIFIDMLDRDTVGSTTTVLVDGWPAIRRAQNDYCVETAGAFVVSTGFDAPHTDGLHRNDAGYQLGTPRMVRSISKALGTAPTDGRGPLPTGATRSGNTLVIQYAANGCNGLVAGAAAVPADYQIGADNTFATILTPTGHTVDGTAMTVTLTFASALPAGVAVRTFQTANVVAANLVTGTYADGQAACPTYPIFSPLVAA